MKKLITLCLALICATQFWASNVITYTATEKLTQSKLEVGQTTFGSFIISHTFADGTGTITCEGDVTTIGDDAFAYCYDLTSVTIPNSVTTIGGGAFSSCSGLTSVTIGNSVKTIGNYAFEGCTGLTSIEIPNSVTRIGDCAFAACYGLISVIIPNSVITIGEGTFHRCLDLTSIDVDAANTHFCSVDGILFNYTKDTLIQYPMGNTRTEYTIPNSITTIGKGAFYECPGLTSVTIGNSVKTIGNYAFEGCTGLTSIEIPDSVTRIGGVAFKDCSGLISVTIGNSVTTIAEGAFGSCIGLTSVTINSGSIVGNKSYSRDYNLNNIFGSQVEEYIIGNSVTTIGNAAFYECRGLTSVTIPNSVTTIGMSAFKDCSALTSVTCEATIPPTCGLYCFDGVDKSIPVDVPALSVSIYQFAEGWKEFYNIQAMAGDALDNIRLTSSARKYLHNGQLIIDRNGQHYSAIGERVR